ncbi:MAG: hypothetical protein J6S41_07775 [Clostridia bacterium]|nr:hypothetical protein [Clostridia bacterium]
MDLTHMSVAIIPMAVVFFAVGIFCAGYWLGSHWRAGRPDEPIRPKPKKGEEKLQQLELEAEMDNFFRYDGSEQARPRDIALKKMGGDKR